jgi:hypothetical protein
MRDPSAIFSLPYGAQQRQNPPVKHWQTALAILAALSASIALADDLKTVNAKEYKNATITRVEPDGITVKFSGGLVKIPFTELSKEVQERFQYDPGKAAAARAAEAAAIQQTNRQVEESKKQRVEAQEQKALENRLSDLRQQEENLRAQIVQAGSAPTVRQYSQDVPSKLLRAGAEESMTPDEKNAEYAARLSYYNGLKQAAARQGMNANDIVPPKWGEADWDPLSRVRPTYGEQAPVSEADIQVLQSQLDGVRKEKEQVRQQLARKVQRQP